MTLDSARQLATDHRAVVSPADSPRRGGHRFCISGGEEIEALDVEALHFENGRCPRCGGVCTIPFFPSVAGPYFTIGEHGRKNNENCRTLVRVLPPPDPALEILCVLPPRDRLSSKDALRFWARVLQARESA